MTNREWLNQLSDKKYLKAIHIFRWGVCNFCSDEFGRCNGLCYENQLAWLKQEHNEIEWHQIELKCDKWRGLGNG